MRGTSADPRGSHSGYRHVSHVNKAYYHAQSYIPPYVEDCNDRWYGWLDEDYDYNSTWISPKVHDFDWSQCSVYLNSLFLPTLVLCSVSASVI